MYRLNNLNEELEYKQFHDYIIKRIIQRRANGVLKILKIPYTINEIIISEIASDKPHLHRLDFVAEAFKNDETNEEICLILEFQSRLPTDEDVKRFFNYATSVNDIKNKKVDLFIICTQEAPYTIRRYTLKDGCTYEMNVISLKDLKADEILKNVENKIKNNIEISDDDIASLQLIAYTSYEKPVVEILKEASELIYKMNIDENEKEAIFIIFNILCANMLNKDEKNQYLKETKNMINPRDEFFHNEGKEEGLKEGKEEGLKEGKLEIAKKLLHNGTKIEEIINLTGLTKTEILKND